MVTLGTVTQGTLARNTTPTQLKRTRAPLALECRTLGITQDLIAAEARCSRPYVAHYFAGRRSPRAVELAIEKLLAERRVLRRRGATDPRPQTAREATGTPAGSRDTNGSRPRRSAHSPSA